MKYLFSVTKDPFEIRMLRAYRKYSKEEMVTIYTTIWGYPAV